jgi:hypothetical protein
MIVIYNRKTFIVQDTGDNLKVVNAKFSTLGWAVYIMSVISWKRHARQHLEL